MARFRAEKRRSLIYWRCPTHPFFPCHTTEARTIYTTVGTNTFGTEETVSRDDQQSDHAFVVVNRQRVKVGISKVHFKDVDVLGRNFMQFCEAHVHCHSQTVTVLPLAPPKHHEF